MRRRNFLLSFLAGLLPVRFSLAESPVKWKKPPRGEVSRIAFGSCAFQWESQPIWNDVVAAEPDLFLFLGDNIYGDWHGADPFVPTRESLTDDYARLASKPEFQSAAESMHFLATWDNHDYGLHNGGADFEHKDMAREVFMNFFGEPLGSHRRRRDGIYTARIFGPAGRRVQVILLDGRWNRGPLIPDARTEEERAVMGLSGSMGHQPNTDPEASMLGDEQWQWLEEQLKMPADVRLICSGTQVVNDTKGMQEWGNFPLERQRLFDLISTANANGVVFLSGNVHFAELCRTDESAYPLYDFTSSGMTHSSPAYAEYPNPYRVGGASVEFNFGLVEISWKDSGSASLAFRINTLGGDSKLVHEVSLDQLA